MYPSRESRLFPDFMSTVGSLILWLGFYLISGMLHYTLPYIFSGEMFAHEFNPSVDIGAFDQGGLSKLFLIFTFFMVIEIPCIAFARALTDRCSKWGYWTHLIPGLCIVGTLLSLIFPAIYMMFQYIALMGWTANRFMGLMYATGAMAIVLLVTYWIVRPSREPNIW